MKWVTEYELGHCPWIKPLCVPMNRVTVNELGRCVWNGSLCVDWVTAHKFSHCVCPWIGSLCMNWVTVYELSHCPGGTRKHNFWNTPVNRINNYIFGILRSKATEWYENESDPRRGGGGWGVEGNFYRFSVFGTPPPEFYWGIHEIMKISSESSACPVEWHPF